MLTPISVAELDNVKNLSLETLSKLVLGKQIIADLEKGICTFRFLKKDGTVRVAHGTLCKELLERVIPSDKQKKGGEDSNAQQGGISVSQTGDVYTKYWDLERNNFRSFRWDSLIDKF